MTKIFAAVFCVLIFSLSAYAGGNQNLIQKIRQNLRNNQKQQQVVKVEKIVVQQQNIHGHSQQQNVYNAQNIVQKQRFREVKNFEFLEDNYGNQFIKQNNVVKQYNVPSRIIVREYVQQQNVNDYEQQNVKIQKFILPQNIGHCGY